MKQIFQTLSHRLSLKLVGAILIFMVGGALAFGVFATRATAGPGQEFGGLISFVFYCTCSTDGSIAAVTFVDLATSGPATPPALIYAASTMVYPFGPPLMIGSWMLGTWQSGGECLYYIGKGCATYPTAGTMYMVGTSM